MPWPADFEPIRRDFGYARGPDVAAAQELAARISHSPYNAPGVVAAAKRLISGQGVAVLGGGASARDALGSVPPRHVLVVADGAALAARQAGRRIDVIVSDLDGPVEPQVAAAQAGALVFVHAHGDNREALATALPQFPPKQVAGSCQVEPPPPLINPGGFTDGDRAVHLAHTLGAKEILLAGFDFTHPGPYSRDSPAATKLKKLDWSRRLIDRLAAAGAPVRYASAPPPRP